MKANMIQDSKKRIHRRTEALSSDRNLLREYVKSIISEGGLSPAEMRKIFKDQARLTSIVTQLESESPFELTNGKVVKFDDQSALAPLAAAIKSGDEELYKRLMANGLTAHEVDDEGKVIPGSPAITVRSMSEILKTKAFGSSKQSPLEKRSAAARGETLAIGGEESEGNFAAAIKKYVDLNKGKPINVVLGNKTITGVLSADATGTTKVDGETSKADVVLNTTSDKVRLSLKLSSAEYYLSGDYLLADIAEDVLDILSQNEEASGVKIDRSRFTTKKNDKPGSTFDNAMLKDGKLVNIKFPLSMEVQQEAVFGRGNNKVDYIVKGDLNAEPEVDMETKTLSWPGLSAISDMSELPDSDQPVGLLRHAAGRGGAGYKGIRPVVVAASRASNAVDISNLMKNKIKSQALRPAKHKKL